MHIVKAGSDTSVNLPYYATDVHQPQVKSTRESLNASASPLINPKHLLELDDQPPVVLLQVILEVLLEEVDRLARDLADQFVLHITEWGLRYERIGKYKTVLATAE